MTLVPIPDLTLTGPASSVYAGSDFPPTIPNSQRVYTFDFVNDIAILIGSTATIGGAITAGDIVGIKFSNSGLQNGDITCSYFVQSNDTPSTIAAAINALINGTQELTQLGVSSTVTGPAITILAPPFPVTTLDRVLAPTTGNIFASETIEFASAAFAGETITSATATMVAFEGVIDPDASATILSTATITGSKVSFLIGNLQAGTIYRVTFIAVTPLQPSIIIYSHIACALPT